MSKPLTEAQIERRRAYDRARNATPERKLQQRNNGIAYRQINQETLRKKWQKFASDNPEIIKERRRRDYQKHKSAYRKRAKNRYELKKQECLKWQAQYNRKNPEIHRKACRKYHQKNRDKILPKARAYANKKYAENQEIFRFKSMIRMRKRQKRNSAIKLAKDRTKQIQYAEQRRNLQLGTIQNPEQIIELIVRLKCSTETKCAYCGVSLTDIPMHIDHIIPLSRGGRHSPENLCASCGPCNLSKNNKTAEEFMLWRTRMEEIQKETEVVT